MPCVGCCACCHPGPALGCSSAQPTCSPCSCPRHPPPPPPSARAWEMVHVLLQDDRIQPSCTKQDWAALLSPGLLPVPAMGRAPQEHPLTPTRAHRLPAFPASPRHRVHPTKAMPGCPVPWGLVPLSHAQGSGGVAVAGSLVLGWASSSSSFPAPVLGCCNRSKSLVCRAPAVGRFGAAQVLPLPSWAEKLLLWQGGCSQLSDVPVGLAGPCTMSPLYFQLAFRLVFGFGLFCFVFPSPRGDPHRHAQRCIIF